MTFLEIIAPEFSHRYTSQLYKMAALTFGFIFIAVLMYVMHEMPDTDFCKALIGESEVITQAQGRGL